MNKFWRKLHFLSTVVAGFFIFLAAITGTILALEPWFLSQNAVSGPPNTEMTIADFQEKLSKSFLEVFSFEKDAYGNIKVEGIGLEKEGTFYVNASTALVIKVPKETTAIFEASRDLHRSLFLKTTGRIIMGLTSLFMVFLALSGIALHLKRAGGLKAAFSSIKLLDFKRDGHARWSRLFFLPILIVSISGVVLSLIRFSPGLSNQEIPSNTEAKPLIDTKMSEIKKLTYPVMDDEPFVVQLAEKIMYIDKTTHSLIKTEEISWVERLRTANFWLHTGEGTKAWASVLLITSLVIVFLSLTGFQMVKEKLRIRKHKSIPTDDTEILILVGSETGHTWRFADALEEAFMRSNIKVSTIGLEHLPTLAGYKTLLILTSTYGDGDAPENAQSVLKKLEAKLSQALAIKFSVLGFGSRAYPAFCAYAEEFRDKIQSLKNTEEITAFMTVDNQSLVAFLDWVKVLNKAAKLNLIIDTEKLRPMRKKGLVSFKILEKKEQNETFLLKINHPVQLHIKSGDLLGVYPPEENIERYYSIASISPTELLLAIKKTGKCSTFLSSLGVGQSFDGFVKANPKFYFPENRSPVLLISNGTGIAPFLGMPSINTTILWGGRNKTDFELYEPLLLEHCKSLIFSRESNSGYVQDLVHTHESLIVNLVKQKGTIMICGSLQMLSGVSQELEKILTKNKLSNIESLLKTNKILTDCY